MNRSRSIEFVGVAAGLAVLAAAVSGWVLYVLTDPEPPLNAGEMVIQACGAPEEKYYDLTLTMTFDEGWGTYAYSAADGDHRFSFVARDLHDGTVLEQGEGFKVGETLYSRDKDRLGSWGEWESRDIRESAWQRGLAEGLLAYPGCPRKIDVSDSVFGRETSRSSGRHIILPTTTREYGVDETYEVWADTYEIWVDSSGRLMRSILHTFPQDPVVSDEGDFIVEKEFSGFGEPNVITLPEGLPNP